jgi:hypothetical protein
VWDSEPERIEVAKIHQPFINLGHGIASGQNALRLSARHV